MEADGLDALVIFQGWPSSPPKPFTIMRPVVEITEVRVTLPCSRERSPPIAALWAMAILIYDGLTDGGLVALQPLPTQR